MAARKTDAPDIYYHLQECPVGWLALLGTAGALHRVSLQPERQDALAGLGPALETASENPAVFSAALAAFDDYFSGDMRALARIPVDLSNAPSFFGAAWQACRSIPPGETRSYQWLAEAAGNPRASRAAGQAMAKNPLPLVVPCHRVIGSGGGLHGYGAGGLDVKSWLLAMERRAANIPEPAGARQPSLSAIMAAS